MIETEADLWWLGTSGSGGGARVSVTTKGQLGGIPDLTMEPFCTMNLRVIKLHGTTPTDMRAAKTGEI